MGNWLYQSGQLRDWQDDIEFNERGLQIMIANSDNYRKRKNYSFFGTSVAR